MNKPLKLHLQIASKHKNIPKRKQFKQWATAVLEDNPQKNEITIRIIDEDESSHLNKTYRHKNGPTNVLSFPFESPPDIDLPFLGDLAICAPLVEREAKDQNKKLEAHWAHLTIHGILHLLGYDHIKAKEAEIMETLEIKLLHTLGFDNPYE